MWERKVNDWSGNFIMNVRRIDDWKNCPCKCCLWNVVWCLWKGLYFKMGLLVNEMGESMSLSTYLIKYLLVELLGGEHRWRSMRKPHNRLWSQNNPRSVYYSRWGTIASNDRVLTFGAPATPSPPSEYICKAHADPPSMKPGWSSWYVVHWGINSNLQVDHTCEQRYLTALLRISCHSLIVLVLLNGLACARVHDLNVTIRDKGMKRDRVIRIESVCPVLPC